MKDSRLAAASCRCAYFLQYVPGEERASRGKLRQARRMTPPLCKRPALIPTCKIIDCHCERSEPPRTRGQSPCRDLWIASSASPPRNDESMILQVGINRRKVGAGGSPGPPRPPAPSTALRAVP